MVPLLHSLLLVSLVMTLHPVVIAQGIVFDERNLEEDCWSRTSNSSIMVFASPSAPHERDLWSAPEESSETHTFPLTQSFNPTVAQLESIPPPTVGPVFYDNQQNDWTSYPQPPSSNTSHRARTERNHSPEELEQRFHYIDSLSNDDASVPIHDIVVPVVLSSYPPRHVPPGHARSSSEHVRTMVRTPHQATFMSDSTNVVIDEMDESSQTSTVWASGVAGAVLGTLVFGTIPGVIAGFYAAYVHNDDGAAGDISRALGEIALIVRRKALMIEARHHVVNKTKVVLTQAFGLAMELNRRHRIAQKVKRFAVFAWALTVDYIRQRGREIQANDAGCHQTARTNSTTRQLEPMVVTVIVPPVTSTTTRRHYK